MLCGCLLPLLSGCEPSTRGGGNGAAATKETEPAEPPSPKVEPYLADWKPPAAALILSGEIHGYLEPCGCSLTQSGGFARRANLLRELDQKKWPYAGFDLGGSLKRFRPQDLIKFEMMLDGLEQLKYAGLGLGVEELLLGADTLISLHHADDPQGLSFLCGNVVLFDSPELGTPRRWKVIQVGDVKIGVTSVLGASLRGQVTPEGVDSGIKVLDPLETLPAVIKEMQQEQPDFLVLLSHGSKAEAAQFAESFPPFRVIVTAGGPEDPAGKPQQVNKSWIVETGHKGKAVGVLGYYPQDEAEPFRFELINLDNKRFQGDERMTRLMRNYQQRLQDEKISEKVAQLPHPSGWQFVGAETCGECHVKSFEKWKETGHAKAYETLIHGRGEENPVSRIYDPECLACHVTGWQPQEVMRYESGFFSADATPQHQGQQCESCHGPGSEHVKLERAYQEDLNSVPSDDLRKLRNALRLTMATAENQVCRQCHDAENSPEFEFDKYWRRVAHPWKD